MAQPITWHNVTGPSMGNPAQFMQMAQNGVDGAFDKLGAVLKQREDTNKANWDQGAVNNTEALKSALYGVTTPEQMAAAQKSGQFNEMLSGFGAQVKDPAALRALMEGRMGVLQKQTTDGIAYDNTITDNREAPFIGEAKALYSQGNVFGGDLAAANVNRGRAALADFSREVQRRGVTEGQADAEAQRRADMFPLDQKAKEAQIRSSDVSANANNANAAATKLTTDDAGVARNFQKRASEAAVTYAKQVDTVYKDHGIIAKSLGMPMLSSGVMDRASMTSDQVAAVDDLAMKNGLPSWKNMPDESFGVRAFTEQALKDGIPASVVLSSQDTVGKLFDKANLTTNTGAGRAADKAKQDRATEKLKGELAANGLAGEGATNAVRNSDAVIKHIEAVTPKDSPDREKLMQFVLEEIGKTPKVNGQSVNYPLGLVKQAINETAGKGGWLFGKGNYGLGNWRGEATVTRMQELLQTPEYLKAMADRAELEGRILNSDASSGGGKKPGKEKEGPVLTDRQKKARSILGLD